LSVQLGGGVVEAIIEDVASLPAPEVVGTLTAKERVVAALSEELVVAVSARRWSLPSPPKI
jgi:hypothetical protein